MRTACLGKTKDANFLPKMGILETITQSKEGRMPPSSSDEATGLSTEDSVADSVAPVLSEHQAELIDVAFRREDGQRIIEICVDDDSECGPSLDTIVALSEILSQVLDAHDKGSAPYLLQVTSPGLDRPLTRVRQWLRNRGRLVTIDTTDGESLRGRIGPVRDNAVVILTVPTMKKGQRINPKRLTVHTVPFTSIALAMIEFEFSEPSDVDWEIVMDDDKLAAFVHQEGK